MANEIVVKMGSANKPPKVKLNGKYIDAIIDLHYNYTTRDDKSPGQHNFTVKYFDKESGVIRTASANRMMEG